MRLNLTKLGTALWPCLGRVGTRGILRSYPPQPWCTSVIYKVLMNFVFLHLSSCTSWCSRKMPSCYLNLDSVDVSHAGLVSLWPSVAATECSWKTPIAGPKIAAVTPEESGACCYHLCGFSLDHWCWGGKGWTVALLGRKKCWWLHQNVLSHLNVIFRG